MCAQALSHQSWAGIQALAFFSYWGHAARLSSYMYSPISVVMRIRDSRWLRANWKTHRRQLGFWPNSYRLIQRAWEEFRGLGSPPDWHIGALDKGGWRVFINTWLSAKQLHPLSYYDNLETVDMLGRSLLQVGEKFTLPPFRHVPVEQPYETSFSFVPVTDESKDDLTIQFCSDGSHKSGQGAGAVVVLPPYTPIQEAVVAQFRVQGRCTSTKAEIRSAILALKMIRSALPFLGEIRVTYLTDPAFVLQVLEDDCLFKCHPHDLFELLDLWKSVCHRVCKKHVKSTLDMH